MSAGIHSQPSMLRDAYRLADEIDSCALHRTTPRPEQLEQWARVAADLADELAADEE